MCPGLDKAELEKTAVMSVNRLRLLTMLALTACDGQVSVESETALPQTPAHCNCTPPFICSTTRLTSPIKTSDGKIERQLFAPII